MGDWIAMMGARKQLDKEREVPDMKKYIIGGVAALVVIGGVVVFGVSQSGNSQAAATPSPEITATPEPTIEPSVEPSPATLDQLSEAQIQIFKEASEAFKQDYINGAISLDQLKLFQNTEIETAIIYNQLPANGVQLFEEWKELVNYYSDLESLKADNGSTGSSNTGSTNTGSSNTGSSSNTGNGGQVNTGNKPNNSDSQNNQQVESGNNGGNYVGSGGGSLNDPDFGSEGLADDGELPDWVFNP